jgi:amidase
MCGVFGLKPTRGRIPLGPEVGDVMHGLVIEHAVTRSVRDSARLLDATEGMDLGAPYAAPGKERPFAEEVAREPGRLKVAFSTESLAGTPVDKEVVAAVRDVARLLVSLGHDVEEKTFEVPEQALLMGAFMAVWTGGVVLAVEGLSLAVGRRPTPAEFEPLTWSLFEMGTKVPLQVYLLAQATLQRFSRSYCAATHAYDVVLTPTCGEPATPLGAYEPDSDPLSPLHRAAPVAAFTAALNVTGQPAMSVPLVWNRAGLPIGVQFAARFGDDATLFRLAAQLEQARPWADRRPPVWAGEA